MSEVKNKIFLSDIILDEAVYPREKIDQKRVGIFAENLRDGFHFDPIEIQSLPCSLQYQGHPERKGKYRILDGVHRWSAYKEVGLAELEVII